MPGLNLKDFLPRYWSALTTISINSNPNYYKAGKIIPFCENRENYASHRLIKSPGHYQVLQHACQETSASKIPLHIFKKYAA